MVVSPRLQHLVEYFAKAEPQTINKLAFKHGFFPPQSLEGRAGFLYEFLLNNGDEGLKELMRFHPDRDAMLSADGSSTMESIVEEPKQQVVITKKEDSSRAIYFVGLIILLYLIITR